MARPNTILKELMESQGITSEALAEKTGKTSKYVEETLDTLEWNKKGYMTLVTAANADEHHRELAEVEIEDIIGFRKENDSAHQEELKAIDEEAEKKKAELNAVYNEGIQNKVNENHSHLEEKLSEKKRLAAEKEKDKADKARKKTETKVESGAAIEVSADAAVEEEFNPFKEETV